MTPVMGLDVWIEGESSNLATPPARTDELGIASQLVKSSDIITISSGLQAILFDPLSGLAMALHQPGVVTIEATRLVEPVNLCRYLDSTQRELLAFYARNRSPEVLSVPQREGLNSAERSDGLFTATQPPISFAPGLSFFVLPLDELRSESSLQCPSGSWRLLGHEQRVTCTEGTTQLDVPLCEERFSLPCAEISNPSFADLYAHGHRIFSNARRLERRLRVLYPTANKNYSLATGLRKGMRRFDALLREIQGFVRGCSENNPRCRQIVFPRIELLKAIERAFRPRPIRGRIEFRATRKRYIESFARRLRPFPRLIVKCD